MAERILPMTGNVHYESAAKCQLLDSSNLQAQTSLLLQCLSLWGHPASAAHSKEDGVKPWQNFHVPLTTQAVAFSTRCNQLVTVFDNEANTYVTSIHMRWDVNDILSRHSIKWLLNFPILMIQHQLGNKAKVTCSCQSLSLCVSSMPNAWPV